MKLHRHSTRSQHRLSLGGTCFYWLNEGLFVQFPCPPWSCILAFMESWRRNQACHEGNALWAFSHNVLSLFCYPDFRVLFFPSCAQVVMLELLCNPRSSHRACFEAAVFLTKQIVYELYTVISMILSFFLVTFLIYSTGSFW